MRRSACCLLLSLVGLLATAAPGHARTGQDDSGDDDRPATYLEADERDDGTTDAAAWMVGSGIAAVLFIGVGGTWMARRQRRQEDDGPKPSA
jgi:hypothetical protein